MDRKSFKRFLEFLAAFYLQFLLKFPFLKLNFFGEKFSTFTTDLMAKVFAEREKSQTKKNDFVDLLVELKTSGKLSEKEIIAQGGFMLFSGKQVHLNYSFLPCTF
jgi:cytochrome P450